MDDYSTPKKMKRVGDLFDRYKKRFKAPQATVEKACVEIIKDVTGFLIEEKQVVYHVSSRTVSVNVPSILKTELKFKNEELLKKLKQKLGSETSPKILR